MRCLLATALVLIATNTAAEWNFGAATEVGARQLDEHLADYRWDAGPVPVFGLDAVARNGRWVLRAGVSRSGTDQSTGLPGVATVPSVALTEIALHGAATVFAFGDFDVDIGAGIGRVYLAWDPERLEADVEGTSIVVDFEPLDRWVTSTDLSLGWNATSSVRLGLRGRASRFSLETAHRRGDAIVEDTESFVSIDATVFVRFLARPSSSPAESQR